MEDAWGFGICLIFFVMQSVYRYQLASHPLGQESDSSSESSTSMSSSEALDIKTLAIVARWVLCCAA